MTSRVLNFLWLNLDLPAPPDPEDGSIRQPLPAKYIENIREASRMHPDVQMVLWVDSRRLTGKQYAFLQETLEDDYPNVHLKDLRAIPAYDKERLYNQAETDAHWRTGGQTSVIWRQVDAAKILVSLQGDFDQSFFADLDHAHLDVEGKPVQKMLKKHGIMIGSASASYIGIENQLWGFTRQRRRFFEQYYNAALKCAYEGENAWYALTKKVSKDLQRRERIGVEEICLPINDDGTEAEQPGHRWRGGYGPAGDPSVITKGELSGIFNAKSKKPPRVHCPNLDVVWTPAPSAYSDSAVARLFSKLRHSLKTSVGLA